MLLVGIWINSVRVVQYYCHRLILTQNYQSINVCRLGDVRVSRHQPFRYGARLTASPKPPPLVKGAKKVGLIRLTQPPYQEQLSDMPILDLEAEGGLWASIEEFISLFGSPDLVVWVVRFELVAAEEIQA